MVALCPLSTLLPNHPSAWQTSRVCGGRNWRPYEDRGIEAPLGGAMQQELRVRVTETWQGYGIDTSAKRPAGLISKPTAGRHTASNIGFSVLFFFKEIEMRRLFLLSGTRTALSIAVLGASALVASTAGATSVPTFNAPGIPVAGFPDFLNSNNINLNFFKDPARHSSDYILTAYGSAGVFNASSTSSSNVNNEIFAMYADFDSSGHFLSGGETIFGCQPPGTSCNFNKIQNLYTVSFDKYGVSTSTVGLGFDTLFSSASGWAKQFQHSNESLYLYSAAMASLDNNLKAGTLSGYNNHGFSATVSELTTVPLPAAAWLFGPAFAALFGVMRRRSRSESTDLDTVSA
jgi:hypothetical protein